MIRGILALVFLGILAAVVHTFPIPSPFNWLITLVLILCALYIVAAMFGLVSSPWFKTGPPLVVFLALVSSLAYINNEVYAKNEATVFKWHEMKSKSNYANQLKNLRPNEYLVVWIGYSDIQLYEQLENGNNCYVEMIAGVEHGILIGKGVQNSSPIIVTHFTETQLNDPKIRQSLLQYIKTPATSLGSKSPEESILLPERSSSPQTQIEIKKQPFVQVPKAGEHAHRCENCGTIFAHDGITNTSHMCPVCGAGPWTKIYQGQQQAQPQVQQFPQSSNCPNGQCPTSGYQLVPQQRRIGFLRQW
jgi:hypothetical protein